MAFHDAEIAGSIHVVANWNYANATARTTDTGFISGDVGKFAWQQDNNTFWVLTATTPTWALVGAASSPFTIPLLSGFTIGNTPTSSTSSDTNTGISLFTPNAGTNTLYAFEDVVAPGGTFTLTMGARLTVVPLTGNAGCELIVKDATGKLVSMGTDPAGAYGGNINYWNSYTSYNSNPGNVQGVYTTEFYRIIYDGTNFKFYAGSDLNSMLLIDTLSATAFIGTPTVVGFAIFGIAAPIAATIFHYTQTA